MTLQQKSLLESNFRYSIFDCQTRKEWYQVTKPRKGSRFWTHRYVIWDNFNKQQVK